MNITDQVQKLIFSRSAFSKASLAVWQDSYLFYDEVQSSRDNPIDQFSKAGQEAYPGRYDPINPVRPSARPYLPVERAWVRQHTHESSSDALSFFVP